MNFSRENDPMHDMRGGYGATSDGEARDDASQDLFYESDDSVDTDNWPGEELGETPSVFRRVLEPVKNAILVILHVENLWDSPDQQPSSRARIVVLFWFFVLALSYAAERCTFKFLVDDAGPFRLLSVEMVTACHAVILGFVMFVAYLMGQSPQLQSLGVSVIDVIFMALLDTVSLLMVYLSGFRVPPTLTVILIQFTLPLTAFLTQFVHPDGCCSANRDEKEEEEVDKAEDTVEHNRVDATESRGLLSRLSSTGRVETRLDTDENSNSLSYHPEETPLPGFGGLSRGHVWGSLIISLAVLVGLMPAFYAMIDPIAFLYADPIPIRTAINSLVYVSSCIPAAASTLYKEYIFLKYKQPVRMDYLNLLLSIFQFIIASVLSPLLFGLQGIGAAGNWEKLYPSSSFSENYEDGLMCFLGVLSNDDQENKYPSEAHCKWAMPLVFLHVLSIIFVGVAVDKVCNAGATKVMYRGVSAGIIIAGISLHVYELHEPIFNYGPAIDGLNLVCLILLVFGSEVYHRVTLQDSTFETEYQPVGDIYG